MEPDVRSGLSDAEMMLQNFGFCNRQASILPPEHFRGGGGTELAIDKVLKFPAGIWETVALKPIR
jgi:hypothetical protein